MGERLSPADASNVVIDAPDQVNSIMLAGLLGAGGFVGPYGVSDLVRLREVVAERWGGDPELRRFGQRVGREGRHLVWQPSRPDLGWHIRQTEAVAGREGLAGLCARLVTTPLPKDRPLWELLIVPGAGIEGPGIVLRAHHAIADGVAGVRLVQRIFDNPPPVSADAPVAMAKEKASRTARQWLASALRVAAIFRPTVPPTKLLGPISQQRGVVFAEVGLAELRQGAKAVGATLNDVLLAAVVEAADAMLRTMGEPVPAVLTASVPVALPDRGGSGNAVGVMVVGLPTGIDDPAARAIHIARITSGAKHAARAAGTFELTRSRGTTRLFGALARHQRMVAFFVTNVRGPTDQLSLAGAPLVAAWPVTPIQGNVRLGVSAFSYAGRLSCAAHLDADALDQAAFVRALDTELRHIAALGRRTD